MRAAEQMAAQGQRTHPDLLGASVAISRWHSVTCAGRLGDAAGYWTHDATIILADGPHSFHGMRGEGGGLVRRRTREANGCGPGCPAHGTRSVIGSFYRFRPGLVSITLDLEASMLRPRGCPVWSGTYVLHGGADAWQIRMFATHA